MEIELAKLLVKRIHFARGMPSSIWKSEKNLIEDLVGDPPKALISRYQQCSWNWLIPYGISDKVKEICEHFERSYMELYVFPRKKVIPL